MKIIAVVGRSGSGKTRLISRLIPELAKLGWTTAVIKHCGHGFDLGGESKDSSAFLAAGAQDVALAGPDGWAVIHRGADAPSLAGLAETWFPAADLVIVEGGKSERGLRKIEVLRQGISDAAETPASELAAVVAEGNASGPAPVFHPDRADALAAWLKGDP
jgi:molybdopterin-guanine dinucleotide biosynthesis adapter protein